MTSGNLSGDPPTKVAAWVQQSQQRQQRHSGSSTVTAPVKAAAKAAAPAKVAMPAKVAAPANQQRHSGSNGKVGSGSSSGSLSWKCWHFGCLQKHNFEDMSLCCPDVSAQHGQYIANIATFDVFFHVICCVVSLIADMSVMQQPASAWEAWQERWQCDERGVDSGNATKNNETMALGGGGGNEQRWWWQQMQGDGKYNNQPNAMTMTMTLVMMMGQR
jgi:hypothetical protein